MQTTRPNKKQISILGVLAFLVFLSKLLMAQSPNPGEPDFRATSRLVTIRIVPADKTAKVFLVGNELADLDLKKDINMLSITGLTNGKKTRLVFKENGDHYLIENWPEKEMFSELEFQSIIRGQKEQLKLKLQKP